MNVATPGKPSLLLAVPVLAALSLAALGCEKKKEPVPEPPPPAPVETAAPVTELAPLVEDAAVDAEPEAAAPVKKGSGMTANQARARQCCNAIRSQAKSLGSSPEANILLQGAALCDTAAAQLNPNTTGQAPEFAMFRQLLQGKTMPAVCQGL